MSCVPGEAVSFYVQENLLLLGGGDFGGFTAVGALDLLGTGSLVMC